MPQPLPLDPVRRQLLAAAAGVLAYAALGSACQTADDPLRVEPAPRPAALPPLEPAALLDEL